MIDRKAILLYSFIIIVLFARLPAALAADRGFSDIKGHWAASEIDMAVRSGLMYGVGNEKFAPDEYVTRAELASVIARVFAFQASEIQQQQAISAYKDLTGKDAWYIQPIALCQVHHIFAVHSLFLPQQRIQRLEIARAIDRAFITRNVELSLPEISPDYKDLSSVSADAIVYTGKLYNAGIMQGYNNSFRPDDPLTRAELARILNVTAQVLQTQKSISETGEEITAPSPSALPRVSTKIINTNNELLTFDIKMPVLGGLSDKNLERRINAEHEQTIQKSMESLYQQAMEDYECFKAMNGGSANGFKQYALLWFFETKYMSANLSSIMETSNFYTGGIHGLPCLGGWNVNLNTGAILKLSDWFRPGSNYISFINDFVRTEMGKEPDKFFNEGFTGVTADQDYYIDKDGKTFVLVFQVYSIAPYSYGMPQMRIPISDLEPYGFRTELL